MKAEPAITVRHYCAGGAEHGGGIGRMIGYLVAASPAPEGHSVTDTRGVRLSLARSPFFLLLALMRMAQDRLVTPDRIHHLHIAGR
ncbi:glycosyltransferase family 1 protein, partial [Thioclava sp. BHET1]